MVFFFVDLPIDGMVDLSIVNYVNVDRLPGKPLTRETGRTRCALGSSFGNDHE